MGSVGVVIVTYNSDEEIEACLDAAISYSDQVIVVDNASTDQTVAKIRRKHALLIANTENRGFAAAVNQGIRAIQADFILLLNPDTVLKTGVEPLCEALQDPKAGGASGKLINLDGTPQEGFNVRRFPSWTALVFEVLLINRLWPSNSVNWHYRCRDFDHDQAAQVEQPAGAFLMFRREVWEKLGGFDERFSPVWFEDVDFCKRLRDHGYYLYYEPRAIATHRGGHAIRKILMEKRELYWYGSLLKYGFKHYGSGPSRVLCLAVMVGSLLRMVAGIALQKSFEPLGVYGRVIRLASRYLLFRPDFRGVSNT